jgi:hypothetical protein
MTFDTSMIAILIGFVIFALGLTAWAAWENWPPAAEPGALDFKGSGGTAQAGSGGLVQSSAMSRSSSATRARALAAADVRR